MVKKWQMLLLGSMLAVCNLASAQWVEVTGVGEDADSALRDAKRNAVEQVVGTYISSETLVSQASVVQDEIYAKAVGFITDVRILDEGRRNGAYNVRARIDVNTNPNSELMNRVEMIKALGDPRIGVVVTYYGDVDGAAKEKYPLMCEAAINNKLAELGFNHVISSNVILNERKLERELSLDVSKLLPNSNIDYLILGKLDISTGNINLPKYTELGNGDSIDNFSTNLINTTARIDIDVLKADTGEVVNSFHIEAKAINNSNNNAENIAVQQIGTATSNKVKSILSRKAAATDNQIQMEIEASDYAKVARVVNELKCTSGVSNVQDKGFNNEKGVIIVETTLKPQTLIRILKEQCNFSVFVKAITANNIVLTTK